MIKRNAKRNVRTVITVVFAVIFCTGIYYVMWFNLFPQKTYSAEKFGIEPLHSTVDYNHNGTDDYTDILLGARQDAENRPVYDGRYYDGGYPPDDIGVCTDVIWRAFKNAGYSLRDMVDRDIQARPEAYTNVTDRDKNIDFRRVGNLHSFFKKYADTLTLDINDVTQWQPGDIVIFGDDAHIGIVSDKRSRKGWTYIIHNGGQPNREENYLKRADVTGHYRFDASQVDGEVLAKWEG